MAKPKLSSQLAAKKKPKAVSKKTAVATVNKAPVAGNVAAASATGASATASVRLPAAWTIAARALSTVWEHRRPFLGIAAIYGVLNLMLVRGVSSSSDLVQLKDLLPGVDAFTTNVALLAFLVTNPGEKFGDVASAYQAFLLLITSLAVVWALRQVMSGATARIRDSFYKGMYPLIPVIPILCVILLGLLPLILSAGLYSMLVDSGIAATMLERILWALVMVVGAAATLFFLSSSVMALYIATLPDMTPLKALRSARELVRGRRLAVIRKMLFLPLAAAVVLAVVMLTIIGLWTAAAPWVFFVLSMVGIVVVHAYLYTLYRELLV